MLQWWAEFRDEFSTEKDWQGIIWNNKDVRINNAPVFYKTFFESGIICVNDLLFDLNNLNSYNIISKHVGKVNFLAWAGLRHAIPSHSKMSNYTFMTSPPTLAINDKVFNVLKKKSKDYYSLLLSKKAQFPSGGLTLKHEFDLTGDELQKAYILSHSVCCEPYIRAFQYKVLNSILFTNTKLYKIGFATDDNCSLCKSYPETLSHFFFDCLYSHTFWKEFEFYFHSISKEPVSLTLKDVIIGIVDSKGPLLNYLLLIAKLYLWDCRRTSMLPEIIGLKHKIKNKFEIEKYVNIKNNTLDKFKRKWTINCNLLLNI